MYYTYILRLNKDEYYTGYSADLGSRIANHKAGKVKATKSFLPVELIFYAAFRNKKLAVNFEDYLKTRSGFAFRNKRLIPKKQKS